MVEGVVSEDGRYPGTNGDITDHIRGTETLRASEERYRLLFEACPTGLILWNKAGRIEGWNQAAEGIFGWTADEARAQPSARFLVPESTWPAMEHILNQLLHRQQSFDSVNENVTRDGRALLCKWHNLPVRNANGQEAAFMSIVEDITARTRTERALKQNHALLQAVIQGTTDAVFVKDLQGRYLLVNPVVAEAMGRTVEEAIGKTDAQLFPPETARALMRSDRQVMSSGHSQTYEDLVTVGGTTRIYQATKRPYRDPDGRTIGVIGVAHDITGIKRTQEALEASEERLHLALDAGEIVIWNVDLATGVVTGSRDHMRVVGLTTEEFGGHYEDFIACIHPEDRVDVQRAQEIAMRDRSVFALERRVVWPDGGIHWLSVRGRFVYDEDGVPYRFCGACVDVTERKWYEAQIAEQIARAEEANQQLQRQQVELMNANARLKELATTDSLTGLKNRQAFWDRLQEEFKRARRYDTPLSLLMLDVDYFKTYNDTYGHLAGDAVLRAVGRMLQTQARQSDLAARYGGEEFVVLLPNTPRLPAVTMAERLRTALERMALSAGAITASIGVTTLRSETGDEAQLMVEADTALYSCKHRGRNVVSHCADLINTDGEVGPDPL